MNKSLLTYFPFGPAALRPYTLQTPRGDPTHQKISCLLLFSSGLPGCGCRRDPTPNPQVAYFLLVLSGLLVPMLSSNLGGFELWWAGPPESQNPKQTQQHICRLHIVCWCCRGCWSPCGPQSWAQRSRSCRALAAESELCERTPAWLGVVEQQG